MEVVAVVVLVVVGIVLVKKFGVEELIDSVMQWRNETFGQNK